MKHLIHALRYTCVLVAPRRGAWVETPDRLSICVAGTVAPRRGAWVETPMVWDKKLGT